jgi:hypothetical protein
LFPYTANNHVFDSVVVSSLPILLQTEFENSFPFFNKSTSLSSSTFSPFPPSTSPSSKSKSSSYFELIFQELVEALAEMLKDKKTTTPSKKCGIMKFTIELLFKEMKLKLSQQSDDNENQEEETSSFLHKKEPISHLLILIKNN